MKKSSWLMAVALAGMGLLAPGCCLAETSCPWINAETVQGILGGEVQSVSVAPANAQGDTSCEFSFKQGDAVFMFRVATYTMSDPSKDFASYLAQCHGARSPLGTAGNEAIHCVADTQQPIEEQVIGRVRDRAFVLTLRRAGDLALEKRSGANDYARDIAQEVAGNLF